MIYIFSSCQAICALPGYACSACGDLCKSCPGACQACATPLRQGCKGCGGFVKHFFEKPLSAYIIISIFLSGATLYMANTDMSTPAGCSSTYLYALMAFAVVNVVFSFYFQYKVWAAIEAKKEEWVPEGQVEESTASKAKAGIGGALAGAKAYAKEHGGEAVNQRLADQEGGAADPGANVEYDIVPAEVVMGAFKSVFMEDFGVLAMFFGLLIMFGLSMSTETLDGAPAAAPAAAGAAGRLLAAAATPCKVTDYTKDCGKGFFWVAATFTLTYRCCTCCAKSVKVARDAPEDYQE